METSKEEDFTIGVKTDDMTKDHAWIDRTERLIRSDGLLLSLQHFGCLRLHLYLTGYNKRLGPEPEPWRSSAIT